MNELACESAARLYLAGQGKEYLEDAKEIFRWFVGSTMINKNDLINDGLSIDSRNSSLCRNNGGPTYTYNQGVILSAASFSSGPGVWFPSPPDQPCSARQDGSRAAVSSSRQSPHRRLAGTATSICLG